MEVGWGLSLSLSFICILGCLRRLKFVPLSFIPLHSIHSSSSSSSSSGWLFGSLDRPCPFPNPWNSLIGITMLLYFG